MGKFRELIVYKKGFSLLMEIYTLTKDFPKTEQYSLVDQMRRSSRSVCSSIGEAYKKRRYPNHFISKLTDADMENGETQVWLDVALACNYISTDTYHTLDTECEEISKLLNYMINNPAKFA
ncbi:four helix bundle protein [Pedobacter petrophilus]|uniref:Four helix bundle protein n=1 Tax=Pedobacter petrophilus TaxID=1908241 RepID=A0A7K0FV93_9SPHI|nr:four helix bundle protein [Pedobacter petrophilus]MRX75341.1 four helix bundle protein [Pedobacter petrophilus]